MPEAIRDTSTSKTWKIEDTGAGRVTLYSDNNIVSSAAPLPVDIKNATLSVNVDVSDTVTVASLNSVVRGTAVSVITSATLIPTTILSNRKSMSVRNNGSATIYLGGSDVTTSGGYPLKANETLDLDIGTTSRLYGRVISTTTNIRILEFS
jgi:hypothetical protein